MPASFHRELGKKLIDVKDPPIMEETEKFWGNIRKTNKEHDKEASWIQRQEDAKKGLKGQRWLDITLRETSSAIKRTSNWKAPDRDRITNFWIKNLYDLHEYLAKGSDRVMKNPQSSPA